MSKKLKKKLVSSQIQDILDLIENLEARVIIDNFNVESNRSDYLDSLECAMISLNEMESTINNDNAGLLNLGLR